MYDGYLNFGGIELVNSERVAAYVENGIAPAGLEVMPCTGSCEDFHEAVGHDPYTSPILDQPPWYDPDNPDSFDFAGLVVLDLSGVNGSTKTVQVVERLGDGGMPVRGRAASRTMAVSALAVARTACGLEAGLAWLTAALHPPCSESAVCGGSPLRGFSCCPSPFCATQDPDRPLAHVVHTGDTFIGIDGAWDTVTDTFVPSSTVQEGTLAGPEYGCVDRYDAHWAVTPLVAGGPLTVAPGAIDGTGAVLLDRGAEQTITGATTVTWTAPLGSWESWRPALFVGQAGAHVTLTSDESVDLTLEECISPLRRSYRNVVTVDGPNIVERIATADGETTLARVEWSWVAADPYLYGEPEALILLQPSQGGAANTVAPGITLDAPLAVTGTSTACPLPAAVLSSCADDPCCLPLKAPPAAPSLIDPCIPAPANFTRQAFQVPPSLIPAGLGVLSFQFTADAKPKVGIRVRIWEDPDPDFGNVPECTFAYEFTIQYLDANQTFVLNGPDSQITSTCLGFLTPQPADRVVRGNFGGPIQSLIVGCGNRYHIVVDTPTTYPTTCSGRWTAGQAQGNLTWSVTLNRKEG
jgi:hypothetical protein